MVTASALLALALPGVAQAQEYGDPEGHTLTALADVRLTASDGEASWLDVGFGKTRFGGPDRARARIVAADLVWQPPISWSLSGTVAVTAQHGQEHAVDLSEAYLSWRGNPMGAARVSARAGLFWPPISLEHGGPAWSVAETITPSAINSWVGEELKGAGVEGTVTIRTDAGRLSTTAGLFGWNDTAGTLLAFRGWALHDEKATAFGRQPLPPLDDFMVQAQAPRTRPVIELDHRPGVYGKIAWAGARWKLQALGYDNRADPEAVNDQLQWGWRTRFVSLGGTAEVGKRGRLTAQAMTGSTRMGFPLQERIWVDTRFRSAFLLGTRRVGTGSVSGRVEAFGTRGRGSVLGAATSENGWAVTAAGRQPITPRIQLLGEVLHVESDRAERMRIGDRAHQPQTLAQLALRAAI